MPITKKCQICGKEFKVYISKTNSGKFCSQECYHEYRKTKERKEYFIRCNNCGKKIKVYRYQLATKKYCSKLCKDKHLITLVENKCVVCGKIFKAIYSRKDKIKHCSKICAYKTIAENRVGSKIKESTKKLLSKKLKNQFANGRVTWNRGKVGVQKGVRGSKSNLWKGGTSKLWWKIISSAQYKKWRSEIFKRDDYKCIKCNSAKRIEAHHIISKAVILRKFLNKNNTRNIDIILKKCPDIININNGETLCHCCHKKTDNYAGNSNKKLRHRN